MSKEKDNVVLEGFALILLPFILVFKLLGLLILVLLLASPLILIGWIVWLVAS